MADIHVLIDPSDTARAVSIAKGLGYSFASQRSISAQLGDREYGVVRTGASAPRGRPLRIARS